MINNWDVDTVALKFPINKFKVLCVCHVESDVRATNEMKSWRNKCVCDSFLVWVNSTAAVLAWGTRELVVVVYCSVSWVTLHILAARAPLVASLSRVIQHHQPDIPVWHTLATVLARVLCPIGVFVYGTQHPLVSLEVSGTVQFPQLLADVAGTSCIGELDTSVGFRYWHDGPLSLVAPSCVKFHLHCSLKNSLCIWGRVRHQMVQLTQSVWLEDFDVLVHF